MFKGFFMKRVFLLTLFFVLTLSPKAFAFADTAFSACVMNAATGEVVWEKNAYASHSMASTTKIMTAIVALENCDINEIVTVSQKASYTEGSAMYIKEGDQFLLKDMLYGLMLNSGNDAAEAIAEHVAGGTAAFAYMMNQKAFEIGAKNTQFQNPSGLDAPGHYTTAYDMALIMKYALQNEYFKEVTATKYIELKPQNSDRVLPLSNHNRLLKEYEGCYSGKTGYTEKTGRCLVSAAERDGMTFIAVTLDDSKDWQSHKAMLDYCYQNHRPFQITEYGEVVNNVVSGTQKCNLIYDEDFTIPLRLDDTARVEVVNHIVPTLYGGFNEGEKLGEGEIIYNGESIANVDIVSDKEVSPSGAFVMRRSFWGVLQTMIKNFLL